MKTLTFNWLFFPFLLLMLIVSCATGEQEADQSTHVHLSNTNYDIAMSDTSKVEKVVKTDEEWKEILTSAQYRILRNAGTELPYINEYNSFYEEGTYVCAACGNPLFSSETKYNSGTGWPSFWEPISESAVGEEEDNSLFMTRTEIICNRCESHLGHVFPDGPDPTGLRYCMNSIAMKFVAQNESD